MKYLLSIILVLALAAPSWATFSLSLQFKPDVCADKTYTPQDSAYWQPCFVQTAKVVQQLNVAFADQMIHGVLKSNPDATQVEGFLGDVNTPANEMGVVTAVFDNYAALKIPYLPPYYLADDGVTQLPLPFVLYLGDTSERKQIGTDPETGEPIYETIYAGEFN